MQLLKEALLTTLLFLPAMGAVPGLIIFCAARWFREKGGRVAEKLLFLGLLALGVGMTYGLLRFTGVIQYPTDYNFSAFWFSWNYRDEGYRYMFACGIPLIGITSALRGGRRAERDAATAEMEEKYDAT